MKLLKYTIAFSALSGAVNAQGLFDVSPNEVETKSSPLKYNVGVALGYDNNSNPSSGLAKESSAYARANLGANLVVRGARTSWDLNAVAGQTRYFDTASNQDTTNARLSLNLNHQINDRVRFISRNFINYGIDLGNFYGAITTRQASEYTYAATDNAVGYRWNDRLATYTGVSYSAVDYVGNSNDASTFGLHHSFRYSVSQKAVVTASYRFSNASYEVGGADRSTQTASVGFETMISDTATVTGSFGAQFSKGTSPYAQLTYANRITDQLRMRAFTRYSLEDSDTVFGLNRYESKQAFRIGFAADYTLSPKVVLTAGGNYSLSDFSDGTSATLADAEWDLLSLYLGATFKLNEATSLRSSINFTDSESASFASRNYDRLRYELSLNYTF